MLKSFEKKFDSFDLKTKVQLFILPLLVIYFIYYFYNINKKENKDLNFVPKIEKKFSEPYLVLFEKIEKIASSNNLEIISLKKETNLVKISLKGNLSKVSKFLFDVENLNNFTNVTRIKYEQLENNSLYELDIRLDKYYSKDLKKIEYKQEDKSSYTLKAIVGNFVVIDEKMYKLGENIDKYKLAQIEEDYVLLKDELSQIKLELKNEKFTKHIN